MGWTLPVWIAAVARAAVTKLLGYPFEEHQLLLLPDRDSPVQVAVSSAALLKEGTEALAIGYCDPGPGLDLTRNLEIWVRASWLGAPAEEWLELKAGEGVGTHGRGGRVSVSAFARELLRRNLRPLLLPEQKLRLEVVLPHGRDLAARTSNAAFGVVDGLALIGTQAEVQRSAAPGQLNLALEELHQAVASKNFRGALTFVIGENGRDIAQRSRLNQYPVIKTGNWLGPLLVAAAEAGVSELLLLGYHGKLIKLAGGIFHTHHHLADGRLETLTALAVDANLPIERIQLLRGANSIEQALTQLVALDAAAAKQLWQSLATAVERRSSAYVARYNSAPIAIGAVLFDRRRQLRWRGPIGKQLLKTSLN